MSRSRLCLLAIIFWLSLCASVSTWAVEIDIRVASAIIPTDQSVSYVANIADCNAAAVIQAGSSSHLQSFSSADTQRDLEHPESCTVTFSVDGAVILPRNTGHSAKRLYSPPEVKYESKNA